MTQIILWSLKMNNQKRFQKNSFKKTSGIPENIRDKKIGPRN
jgi:hypothetical protein